MIRFLQNYLTEKVIKKDIKDLKKEIKLLKRLLKVYAELSFNDYFGPPPEFAIYLEIEEEITEKQLLLDIIIKEHMMRFEVENRDKLSKYNKQNQLNLEYMQQENKLIKMKYEKEIEELRNQLKNKKTLNQIGVKVEEEDKEM